MKILIPEVNKGNALLVFFQGWGQGDAVPGFPAPRGFDLVLVRDYTDPALPDSFRKILNGYSRRILAAWSLGVAAAAEAFGPESGLFSQAVAINGTPAPVDSEYGIPPAIFHGTLEHWDSAAARLKFERRMRGGTIPSIPCSAEPPEIQKAELAAMETRFSGRRLPNIYTHAILGTEDRIFPPENQRNYWRSADVPVVECAMPHCPFGYFPSWEAILDAVF